MNTWQRLVCGSLLLCGAVAVSCNENKTDPSQLADQGTGGSDDLAGGGGGDNDLAGGGGGGDMAQGLPDLVLADLTVPAPVLTGITPDKAATTGGDSIQLAGTGFQVGATVTIDGQAATVTQTTPTMLTVTVPKARVGTKAKDKLVVVVRNPDTKMAMRADIFSYFYGTVQFGAGTAITVGSNPYAVAIAELNNNAKPDLLVTNYFDNNVGFLLGNGDGTFGAMGTANTAMRPASLAVADFNNDTFLDAVSADYSGYSVSVMLNDKLGRLGNGTTYALSAGATSTLPLGIDAKDVNNDTFVDVVTANGGSNDLTFFKGKAGAALEAPQTLTGNMVPHSVVLADVDKNGTLDLVAVHENSGNAKVLLGDGKAAFTFKADAVIGGKPYEVVVGDFNGDGLPDLAVSLNSLNKVALVPGNGDGTFKTAMMFDAGTQPWGLAAGDFNGDGVPDVVTTLNGENAVVPIVNKNGTLTALTKLTTGMGPRGVAVGDLNGDGKPDFIVANSSEKSVMVFLNTSQ